ncbi:podoplanin isoform X2 [Camelus ferus]|uniref:Podoplanin isoform X2 n=2 Tax=Camelus TaxID=9836 RepID=A0A8B8U953_CAMFR|nr:podoplanin isoform X2 [Camelus dromedarius]XP_032351119.1 podoplanin isoform X2 [Camelus ferus]XP_045374465.1 podoplanin isoform X2 [Camelus bactrianus]
MWKVPLLFCVLGSASLWVLAGASTVRPEDDVTQGVTDGKVIPRVEDYATTPSASEEPHKSAGLTALVPTRAKSVTDRPGEDLPTAESTVHVQEESRGTTTSNAATSRSSDGLETVTLVGIVVGVLLAIGVIGGIIIVAVRKMSGRYSP